MLLKNLLSTFILLAHTLLPAYAQNVFYCDPEGDIHSFEISTCQDSIVFSDSTDLTNFLDLTFASDGELYGLSFTGKLFRIDLVNQDLIQLLNCCDNPFGFTLNSLTADNDGNIYGAGREVFKYNLATNEYEILGPLPNGLFSAGDMTYYQGQLYLSLFNQKIMQINTNNIDHSNIVFFASGFPSLLGFATDFYDCDSSQVFGSSQFSGLAQVDIFNETVLSLNCGFPKKPLGLAFQNEYLAADCESSIFDLDGDNSSGKIDFNYLYKSCPIFPMSIVDTDIVLSTHLPIDSIKIHFEKTPLNGMDEIIFCDLNSNINVDGNYSQEIKLTPNNLNTKTIDFKDILKSFQYQNLSTNPYLSEIREFTFEVWLNSGRLMKAHSFVQLRIPYAGEDMDTAFCNNLVFDHNLFSMIDPTADEDGCFHSVSPLDSNSQLPILQYEGDFHYIVSAANCPDDTALVSVKIETFNFSLGSNLHQCKGDTVLLNIEIPTSSVIWQDGSTDTIFEARHSGVYKANIITEGGCEDEESIFIWFHDTAKVYQNITLCEGEMFEWGNETFITDTSFCKDLAPPYPCPDTDCYRLNFLPVLEEHDTIVCPNEEVVFKDTIYSEEGIHFSYLKNECQTIVQYDLAYWPIDTTWIDIVIQHGDVYFFENNEYVDRGEYVIHLTDQHGCDSLVKLKINKTPFKIFAPNAFSPNGDNVNDYFNLFSGTALSSILELQVFDRWGGLIFNGKNITPSTSNEGWDGMYNGQAAEKGIYTWRAVLQLKSGDITTRNGDIILTY